MDTQSLPLTLPLSLSVSLSHSLTLSLSTFFDMPSLNALPDSPVVGANVPRQDWILHIAIVRAGGRKKRRTNLGRGQNRETEMERADNGPLLFRIRIPLSHLS